MLTVLFLCWIWVGSFFMLTVFILMLRVFIFMLRGFLYAEGFYFYAEGFYFYANECNCRGALLENVIVAGL